MKMQNIDEIEQLSNDELKDLAFKLNILVSNLNRKLRTDKRAVELREQLREIEQPYKLKIKSYKGMLETVLLVKRSR